MEGEYKEERRDKTKQSRYVRNRKSYSERKKRVREKILNQSEINNRLWSKRTPRISTLVFDFEVPPDRFYVVCDLW